MCKSHGNYHDSNNTLKKDVYLKFHIYLLYTKNMTLIKWIAHLHFTSVSIVNIPAATSSSIFHYKVFAGSQSVQPSVLLTGVITGYHDGANQHHYLSFSTMWTIIFHNTVRSHRRYSTNKTCTVLFEHTFQHVFHIIPPTFTS